MRKKRKSSEERLNKQSPMDRNERARQAIKAKYEQEAQERITHNEQVISQNEARIKQLERVIPVQEIQLEMEHAKLSGLKVLDPKFEFETTETWKELNRKLIDMGIKNLKEDLKTNMDALETLLTQNQRCLLENEQQKKKMEELDGATFDGEEVPEGIEIVDTRNNPLAS